MKNNEDFKGIRKKDYKKWGIIFAYLSIIVVAVQPICLFALDMIGIKYGDYLLMFFVVVFVIVYGLFMYNMVCDLSGK